MPPKNKKKKKKPAKTAEEKAEAEAKRSQANRQSNLASKAERTPRELAEEAKEAGNAALAEGDLAAAVGHYTQAIQHDHSNHVYWSNRSAALLKQGNIKGAISDGEMCIEVNEKWGKGYSRLGAALFANGELTEARKIYKQGLEYAASPVHTAPPLRPPLPPDVHGRGCCTVRIANFDEPVGVATHWRWAWPMKYVQPPTHSECTVPVVVSPCSLCLPLCAPLPCLSHRCCCCRRPPPPTQTRAKKPKSAGRSGRGGAKAESWSQCRRDRGSRILCNSLL